MRAMWPKRSKGSPSVRRSQAIGCSRTPARYRPRHPADLRAALTARYFADYADHWQRFMNTVQWEPAPTLPAAIDQLKLMADARQSPVIALMTSLEYQGGAGMRADSLSDTLVAKAQDMLGKKPAGPKRAKPDTSGPLGPAFGPISRLLAQDQAGTGDMSLQRFLERATALRLRLQQVSNSPDADAQARQMAQALFQGKASELADTQAYARLIAASLGAEWAGMGEALFVRPIAQATHAALQPAQTSLNAAWREKHRDGMGTLVHRSLSVCRYCQRRLAARTGALPQAGRRPDPGFPRPRSWPACWNCRAINGSLLRRADRQWHSIRPSWTRSTASSG